MSNTGIIIQVQMTNQMTIATNNQLTFPRLLFCCAIYYKQHHVWQACGELAHKTKLLQVLRFGVCVLELMAFYNGGQHGFMNYTR